MSALSPVADQPPPSSSESFTATQALTLILTVLLLFLFFVGFFSVYFCRCFMENVMSIFNSRRSGAPLGTPINPSNPDPPGLDPDVVNSFPEFDYSSVKEYRGVNSGALECAICLSEFQEDDSLRLIPECCHVFHKECIDLWLGAHTSCPVCRRGLEPMAEEEEELEPVDVDGLHLLEGNSTGHVECEGSYGITVKDGDDEIRVDESVMCGELASRFSRSHSTGHSIGRRNEEAVDDKYTLRLPEHVKETIGRGHVQTLSCTTLGELERGPTPRGGRGRGYFGEL